MKTRTLSTFFEENGVNLLDLSEAIGVSPEELETVKDFYFVSEELADKITRAYSLPENYFSEDLDACKTRSVGYFIGLDIAWSVILGLLYIPGSLIALLLAFVFKSEAASAAIGIGTLALYYALSIASCIFLARYVERNNAFTGNFSKYKFLYLILPGAVTSVLSSLELMIHNNSSIVVIGADFLINILSIAISCVLTAVLMEACYNGNEGKTVKIYCGIGIVSLIINQIFSVIYGLNESGVDELDALGAFSPALIIQAVVSVLLFALLSFGITKGKEKFPKLNSLWYNVIPIMYLFVPLISIVLGLLNFFKA